MSRNMERGTAWHARSTNGDCAVKVMRARGQLGISLTWAQPELEDITRQKHGAGSHSGRVTSLYRHTTTRGSATMEQRHGHGGDTTQCKEGQNHEWNGTVLGEFVKLSSFI